MFSLHNAAVLNLMHTLDVFIYKCAIQVCNIVCSIIISGPAPENVTNAIFELTKTITSYKICPDLKPDISVLGRQDFSVNGHTFTVNVVDSVKDYAEFMKEIFDFSAIKTLLDSGLTVLINAMNGGNNVSSFTYFSLVGKQDLLQTTGSMISSSSN